MASDHIEGVIKQGVGRVEDGAGGVTGDLGLQAKGKLNEAAGAVQGKIGDLKDQAKDTIDHAQDHVGEILSQASSRYDDVGRLVSEKPMIAVGIAAIVGLGVGLALRGRSASSER